MNETNGAVHDLILGATGDADLAQRVIDELNRSSFLESTIVSFDLDARRPVTMCLDADGTLLVACDDGTVWFPAESVNPRYTELMRRRDDRDLSLEDRNAARAELEKTERYVDHRWDMVRNGPIPGSRAARPIPRMLPEPEVEL